MEETMIEIPEPTEENGWQPPVLTHCEPDKPIKPQRCTDVFLIQYVICLLFATSVFVLYCTARSLCDAMMLRILAWVHAPTEPWILQLIDFLEQQWR